MNLNQHLTKRQKVKNSSYVSAGSLASLRNKKASKHKHKQNMDYISAIQVMKSNEKDHNHKQNLNYILDGSQVSKQVQQVSLNSTSPTAHTIHEKVQQLLPDSTSLVSQVAAHEKGKQQSRHPTTAASQLVQSQRQQHPQDSTNLEENNQSEEQGPTLNKKKRGGKQMPIVHGRTERRMIVLNELNQPIGPTKAVVTELGSFLGTLARNGTFCPLNVFKWKMLKTHDDMWNYVKEKYDISDVGKDWVLRAIKLAWRGYKSRLKKKHFYAYENDEIRMAKRPQFVSESKMSSTNKENRKKLRYPHTVGKTSFAIIREEKKKETPNALSDKDFFVATRRRKPGRVYKDSHEDITAKITEMERLETQESEDGSQSVDVFTTVMGSDHPGRVRLYGRGVTKTLLKKKLGDSAPSSHRVDEEMMQKKMEEMEERMQQRMQEKFDAQKSAVERDVTMNIISQLQRLNPGLTLDPNMLRFGVHSSRDGDTIEPSNSPGAQGVENEEMEESSSEDDLDLT